TPIGGGVSMQPRIALDSPNLLMDEKGADRCPIPRLAPGAFMGRRDGSDTNPERKRPGRV
ncbi:MAG: hypothetical protein ACKOK8_09425, partial [Planctomycetia bacterium]